MYVWMEGLYGRGDVAKDVLFKECKAEAYCVVYNTGAKKRMLVSVPLQGTGNQWHLHQTQLA